MDHKVKLYQPAVYIAVQIHYHCLCPTKVEPAQHMQNPHGRIVLI